MKKSIFSAAILIVLTGLNLSVAEAQQKHSNRTLVITNGDTIINGRDLSRADKAERKRLLDEMKQIEKGLPGGDRDIVIRRGGDKLEITREGKEPHVLFWDDEARSHLRMKSRPHGGVFRYDMDEDSVKLRFSPDSLFRSFTSPDSLFRSFHFRTERLDSLFPGGMPRNFQFRRGEPGADNINGRSRFYFPSLGLKKNSSQFNYNYVDKDGIEEDINISLSETSPEEFKKISRTTDMANTLDVRDLTIFPDLSTGGLNLTFKLGSSGSTRIKVLNSNLTEIFSDSDIIVNSAYLKPINITRNGMYYVVISQGGKWFVKKLLRR